jgi:formylmethanofuran dehydrogenase subunit E
VLFSFALVRLVASLESIMSRPGVRVDCSRCGEEVINERQVVVDGLPVCRACARAGYYEPVGNESLGISLPGIPQPVQERIG